MLKLKNISVQFGGIKALTNVSFEVEKNTLFSIIGPNGAGKTTMDISQDGNKYTMNISGIISTRTVEVVADGTEQEAKTDDGKKKVTAKIDGGKLIITATGAKHSPITSTFEVVDGKLVRTYTLEGVTGWTKFEKNDKK